MPWTSEKEKQGLIAQREVPPDVSKRQIIEEIPVTWTKDVNLWGYVNRYILKGSGIGFITPPYMAYFERIWGATPVEDLGKYKDLYTFTPFIKASIDVTVNLTVSNGFELEGGDDAVREWLENWLDEHNILQTLRITSADELIFGNAYLEICREEGMPPEQWSLKALDPVHMRVRRNEYGSVFGFLQLLTFPPVVFEARDIVHFRYGSKSWWYEFSYGTSLLRPLLLVQALIDDFQTEMATLMKIYTKPMLIVQCGTPERPFSDAQLAGVVQAFQSRGPATDVFVRGDVNVQSIQSMTRQINVEWWLKYLHVQRIAVLGVPKLFLGETEGINRATADVVMEEYVARIRMNQEAIADTLETVLFKQLIEAKFGEGVEVPEVKWRPVWEPTLDLKEKYLGDMVDKGIITSKEARAPLGFPEDVPTEQQEGILENGEQSAGSAVQVNAGTTSIVKANGKRWLIAEAS
jgi:hypothetical protein